MEDRRSHGSVVHPVQLVERLISRLGQQLLPSQGTTTHTASALPPDAKPLMLTLHCLFPNELLLALDILDRGLVRRLARQDTTREATDPLGVVFFVISASAAPSTPARKPGPTRAGQLGYEVRLQAWNCTCPAFVLAAFRDPGPGFAAAAAAAHETGPRGGHVDDSWDGDRVPGPQGRSCYPFGGSLSGEPIRASPPVCKHLLACLLMARCPGAFGSTAEEASPISVPAEELAGWCAGWSG